MTPSGAGQQPTHDRRREQVAVREEPAIQIEQRQARCLRCGKMINLRGSHLVERRRDGSEALFCALICRDEYEELFGLADSTDVGSEDRT